MGLKSDIKDAFLKSMGNPEDEGNVDGLASDLSNAIIDWLQDQTFEITEMRATLEVDSLNTTGPLTGDVLPSVTTAAGGGPVIIGTKGVLLPPVNLKRMGGQGGTLLTEGNAWINKKTSVSKESSKVKLVKVKNK